MHAAVLTLRLVNESENHYSISQLPFTSAGAENLVSSQSLHDQTWASEVKQLSTEAWLSAGTAKGKKSTSLSWNGRCPSQGTGTATRSAVLSSEISPRHVSWQWYSIRKVTDGWLDWMSTVNITKYGEKNNSVFTRRELCPCPGDTVLLSQGATTLVRQEQYAPLCTCMQTPSLLFHLKFKEK